MLLIGENGPLGKMSAREALSIAMDHRLDLVKISPNANPPVCKLMDYGKYCFERKKKEKEAKKKQNVVELKEIKLSVKIGQHDLETKAKHAREFVSVGNKVKVSIRFRGREINNPDLGTDVINRFCDLCKDFASPEGKFSREGKQMFLILSKKKMEDQSKLKEQSESKEQSTLEESKSDVHSDENVNISSSDSDDSSSNDSSKQSPENKNNLR